MPEPPATCVWTWDEQTPIREARSEFIGRRRSHLARISARFQGDFTIKLLLRFIYTYVKLCFKRGKIQKRVDKKERERIIKDETSKAKIAGLTSTSRRADRLTGVKRTSHAPVVTLLMQVSKRTPRNPARGRRRAQCGQP